MIRATVGEVNNMVDVFAGIVAAVLVMADTAGACDDVGPGGLPAGGVGASFAAVPVMALKRGGHSDITISVVEPARVELAYSQYRRAVLLTGDTDTAPFIKTWIVS